MPTLLKQVKYSQEFRRYDGPKILDAIWHLQQWTDAKIQKDGSRLLAVQNRHGVIEWVDWNTEVEIVQVDRGKNHD